MLKFKQLFQIQESKELSGHKDKVQTIKWSSDGRKLASGSLDKTARVYTTDRIKDSVELKGHSAQVDQLAWDPVNVDRLCTASPDKTIKLWDLRVPSQHVTIQTPGENINVAWSPEGNTIAVGDKEDSVTFIDIRNTQNPLLRNMKLDVEINEIGWNWTGDLFFLTTGKGTFKIMKFPDLELMHEIQGHTSNIYCMDFDLKGRYFALGGADALASVWDINDLYCIQTFGQLDWPIRSLSLSFDGELIALGSEELSINISHVESGETIQSIKCQSTTNSIAWHPSKYILAYAGDEVDRYGRALGNVRLKVFGSR